MAAKLNFIRARRTSVAVEPTLTFGPVQKLDVGEALEIEQSWSGEMTTVGSTVTGNARSGASSHPGCAERVATYFGA